MDAYEELLDRATVLVELGWLHDAELDVVEILDRHPDDARALGLFAKIKHIKGELSQAIGCWARLYLLSGQAQSTQTHLIALMHLAEDPERGAGEFLLAGGGALARRPAGQLGIEDALRLLKARRIDEARARCVEIAARYRSSDPTTYKLAVLAIAWIAELSGDLPEAAAFLERLGKERGFETDRDRLVALERVNEAIGTRERLQAAVRLCRHLLAVTPADTVEHMELEARLAALHRRLGDPDEAIRHAEAYTREFRRHMHRPSFVVATRVAATAYVPLARLARLSFGDRALPPEASRRQRAIADALCGGLDAARVGFAATGATLDQKYLADLAVLGGDEEAASAGYLEALARDPDDLQVAGWLLDRLAQGPDEVIAAQLRAPVRFERLRAELDAALRRAPLRPSLWARMATLHDLRGETVLARRCRERAAVLREAAGARRSPIGRVFSASVYHFVGTARGLIHELWVRRTPVSPGTGGLLRPGSILGNLTPEMKDGVRNTFLATREYARSKFPQRTRYLDDFEYTFKIPKEDEPSGGLSAGLPTALAFLSVFLQRPVPQGFAFSGVLVADAHDVLIVRAVGDAALKAIAAYHRNLRCIVLPAENRASLLASPVLPLAVHEELVRYAADLDGAVRLVWGDDVFMEPAP